MAKVARFMVSAITFLMALASPGIAQMPFERPSLAGLRGLLVMVEEVPAQAQRDGLLTSTLQTDAELRLRQAGIRVLDWGEAIAAPGQPVLHLSGTLVKNQYLYAGCIHLEVMENVRLVRDQGILVRAAPTWNAPSIVFTVEEEGMSTTVRKRVRDMVDRFINEYLAANRGR